MSKQKKSQGGSVTFDGFGGIDRASAHNGGLLADRIENFRIRADGSLQKREGFRFIADLGDTVRAYYSTTVNGEYTLYVLLSDTVYILDILTGGLSAIGSVGTSSGSACFFHFRKSLYIADGSTLYEYKNNTFVPVLGYVPLVIKDWANNILGEPHEPINILNRHARATFVVADPPSPFLCVGAPVESIEAVYVNRSLERPDRCSIDNGFCAVCVQGLEVGDRVEVYFTYLNGYDTLISMLCSSELSALFGGIGNSRIFLGGEDRSGTGTVFGSKNVESNDIEKSQLLYPDSNGLYFPLGFEFDAGSGTNRVQSIIRHNDRILIFTEGDVWMVSPDEDDKSAASSVSVNARLGCPVKGGAVLADNDIYSVGKYGIWKWTAQGGSQGGYKAENISAPIDSALDGTFLKSCGLYYDTVRRELWLYGKLSSTAWIYNTEVGAWYSFTGFSADCMLDLDGRVGFLKDNKLYAFSEELNADIDENNTAVGFTALYTSNLLDFGTSDHKNLLRAVLRCDLHLGSILLKFETDGGERISYTLSDSKNYDHSIIEKRLCSGRFKFGSLSLSCPAGWKQTIHSLTLYTR